MSHDCSLMNMDVMDKKNPNCYSFMKIYNISLEAAKLYGDLLCAYISSIKCHFYADDILLYHSFLSDDCDISSF